MIKYSLIVLAATAVIMSSGCDDSDCCGGTKSKPTAIITGLPATITGNSYQVVGNTSNDKEDGTSLKKYEWFKSTDVNKPNCSGLTAVATGVKPNITGLSDGANRIFLKVTDKDGNTDCTHRDVTVQPGDAIPFARVTPSLGTCTPGATINISGETSTDDGSVASYAWTGADSTSGSTNTIICPQTGSKEVCLVVTDNTGNKSTNMACETVTAKAATSNCSVSATQAGATDIAGATSLSSAANLTGGGEYTFTHNCGSDCTWKTLSSVRKDDNGNIDKEKKCIENSAIVAGNKYDSASKDHATTVDDANNRLTVQTCGSVTGGAQWREITIEVECTSGNNATNYFKLDN